MTYEQWNKLPLPLRERYWAETNYGERRMGPELKREIAIALYRQVGVDVSNPSKSGP
jgi:hypothetical protein